MWSYFNYSEFKIKLNCGLYSNFVNLILIKLKSINKWMYLMRNKWDG